MADWRVANTLNAVTHHHISQERKFITLSKLQSHQPHQLWEQIHAESHSEILKETEITGRGDHSRRADWLSKWKKYHRTDLHHQSFV